MWLDLAHVASDLSDYSFQEFQLANRLLVFAPNGQVYFSCNEAVYSEEIETGKSLDPDISMLDGMQSLKLHSSKEHVWSTYQRAVRTFTSRHMSHETDVLNAFAGILRMICPGRSIEGIATSIFDLALLWQPRERLRRRGGGFSSWSWAGWKGKVHWFDDGCLEGFANDSSSETDQVMAWTKTKAWIVWYSSWGTNISSPAYLIDGPPWLRGTAPSLEAHSQRFPGLPNNFAPKPSLIPKRLSGLEWQRKHTRYLQFWTISVYFHIELDQVAVLRWSSFQPESTGSGLRLFLLRDRFADACGWVLLDEGWVEKSATTDIQKQEFILLSEGTSLKSERGNGQERSETGAETDTGEFNAMMITWIGGIAERAGVGRVKRTALANSCWRDMRWKEIVLG